MMHLLFQSKYSVYADFVLIALGAEIIDLIGLHLLDDLDQVGAVGGGGRGEH